jgi:hypothetical protein
MLPDNYSSGPTASGTVTSGAAKKRTSTTKGKRVNQSDGMLTSREFRELLGAQGIFGAHIDYIGKPDYSLDELIHHVSAGKPGVPSPKEGEEQPKQNRSFGFATPAPTPAPAPQLPSTPKTPAPTPNAEPRVCKLRRELIDQLSEKPANEPRFVREKREMLPGPMAAAAMLEATPVKAEMTLDQKIEEWLGTEALNPATWTSVAERVDAINQETAEMFRAMLERIKAECPGAGNGLHFHMCKVANWLRHEYDEDEGVEVLQALAEENGYSERMARYHAEQLRKKWHESADKIYVKHPKIEADLELISKIVYSSSLTANQIASASPVKFNTDDTTAADKIADMLFPDGDIICVSKEREDAHCHRRADFVSLDRATFIVPNPMRESGDYQPGDEWKPGHLSPRCQENVLYRRWFVIEYDISRYARDGVTPTYWKDLIDEWEANDISIQDAQARLIQALAGDRFNLAMIVFSGNKSLQSWWAVNGASEDDVSTFISRSVKLGADRAAKTTSQFFRVPAGWNHNKQCRQQVVYFNPEFITQRKS